MESYKSVWESFVSEFRVVIKVYDDEVTHYKSVNLTSATMHVFLLPPPTTISSENLIVGLSPFDPPTVLFHKLVGSLRCENKFDRINHILEGKALGIGRPTEGAL